MARGGRRSGVPNYQNVILIRIISTVKPNGALLWQLVAEQYQRETGEEELRNPDDIKRHWYTNLCNKMCKPTGRTGGNMDRILQCIRIQCAIMKKTDSVMMGIESDDDAVCMYNGDDDDDDEEEEDRKPAAIDNTTVSLLVEESLVAAPLPPMAMGMGAANAEAAVLTDRVTIADAAATAAVGAAAMNEAPAAGVGSMNGTSTTTTTLAAATIVG